MVSGCESAVSSEKLFLAAFVEINKALKWRRRQNESPEKRRPYYCTISLNVEDTTEELKFDDDGCSPTLRGQLFA